MLQGEIIKQSELYNDDCLNVMKKLVDEGRQVDMIFTDPPYKMTARGTSGTSGGMLTKKVNMRGNVFDFNNIDIEEYLPYMYALLKDGGHCYIMTNHINLTHFLKVIDEWKDEKDNKGFHFIKSLIWDKGNKIMGRFYMSQFEYILFLRKGKGVRINNCGTSDILAIPNKKTKDLEGKNIHDTEKPVALSKILIENSTQEGETVLDCFMGVGGTGVACEETGRKFIGIEIDENYYKIAKERILSS